MTGLPRKHDFTRSESENWRTSRDDQNGEDDEGGWRLAGCRRDSDRWCPPSPGGHCTDRIINTFIFDKLSLDKCICDALPCVVFLFWNSVILFHSLQTVVWSVHRKI